MDQLDKEAHGTAPGKAPERLLRRSFVAEFPDKTKSAAAPSREHREFEYVAVPREVQVQEEVRHVPVKRIYHDVTPEWKVQHTTRTIPEETYQYSDEVTEVAHKRVVDEYVEVPYDAGTEIKCVPRVEVHEREIEVTVPKIKWIEKKEVVPEIRELIRYVEADHNTEQVIKYIPDSPSQLSGDNNDAPRSPGSSSNQFYAGRETLSPAMHGNYGVRIKRHLIFAVETARNPAARCFTSENGKYRRHSGLVFQNSSHSRHSSTFLGPETCECSRRSSTHEI